MAGIVPEVFQAAEIGTNNDKEVYVPTGNIKGLGLYKLLLILYDQSSLIMNRSPQESGLKTGITSIIVVYSIANEMNAMNRFNSVLLKKKPHDSSGVESRALGPAGGSPGPGGGQLRALVGRPNKVGVGRGIILSLAQVTLTSHAAAWTSPYTLPVCIHRPALDREPTEHRRHNELEAPAMSHRANGQWPMARNQECCLL